MREAKSGFDLFLGSGLDQAVRLVVAHEWSRKLRLGVLWEAPAVLVAHLLLAPLRAYLWLTSFGLARQQPAPLPWPRLGLFHVQYTIGLRVFGQENRLLQARDARPTDDEALYRHLGSVLHAAHQRRLVALEMVSLAGGRASRRARLPTSGRAHGQVHQAYFGGQPLMAAPGQRCQQACEDALGEARIDTEITAEGATLRQRDRSLPRPAAWLRLLLLLPVVPLCALGAGGRRWLREAWCDAQGVPPRERRLELDASGVAYSVERRGVVERRATFDASEWLAVAHSPAPDFARGGVAREASVRLLSRRRSIALDLVQAPAQATFDLLVLWTQRLRERNPDPRLPHAFSPAHCFRCASVIDIRPGSPCATCGATPPC